LALGSHSPVRGGLGGFANLVPKRMSESRDVLSSCPRMLCEQRLLVVNDDEGRQRRQPGPHAFEGARRDVNVLPDKKRWLENDLVPRDLPARSDQSRRSY